MIKDSRTGNSKVSVALATFNGGLFLERQLDSIFSQTYGDIEVVAVDDRSYDETPTILERYCRRGKLRFVVNEEHVGYVKTFEKAILLSSGKYIGLADQDDVWDPRKIETLLGAIGEKSLVCSDLRLVDDNGRVVADSFREYQGLSVPPEGDQFRHLVLRNYVTGSSLLFRREILDHALPFPTDAFPHDWWLALHASCVRGIRYISKPLTLYRQHSENVIGAKRRPTIADAILFGLSSEERAKAYQEERKRFLYLLERGVYPNAGRREYLNDLIRYCDSHLNSRIHIDAVKIAFKYRDVFFPGMGSLQRAMFLFGKLFG